MKKLAKEIPINCKICVHCIQDENGKFFCSFDESNPNLLGLLECHELKLGIISLVEYLEERDKKISALEEWKKAWSVQISDYIEKYGKKIEALERILRTHTPIEERITALKSFMKEYISYRRDQAERMAKGGEKLTYQQVYEAESRFLKQLEVSKW